MASPANASRKRRVVGGVSQQAAIAVKLMQKKEGALMRSLTNCGPGLGLLILLVGLPDKPLTGATLLSDVRKVEVYARVGTSDDHKIIQAAFGESPFSTTASAEAHGKVGSDIGGTGATASINTRLALDASGFHSVSGTGSASAGKFPAYFGAAAAHSVVDETFHLDGPHAYKLEGGDHLGAVIRLENVGGQTVYSAPGGGFYSAGVLVPGDYRILSDLAIVDPFGTAEGSFNFNFSLFAHPMPPPNSYIGDISPTLILAIPHGTVFGFEVTIGVVGQDPSGPPAEPLIFDNLFLTEADSGRIFTKMAGDPGFDDFAAILTNGVPDTIRTNTHILFGGSWTEQSLFTSSTGAPYPFTTDFHGQQIQSISLVVNSVLVGRAPGLQSGRLDAYLAVQVVPEPSTIVLALFCGLSLIWWGTARRNAVVPSGASALSLALSALLCTVRRGLRFLIDGDEGRAAMHATGNQ